MVPAAKLTSWCSTDKLILVYNNYCVDLHVVALDWPGHGRSSHRALGASVHVYDYVSDIKYAIDGECRVPVLLLGFNTV